MPRLCVLCKIRWAEVPDRDRPGRPVKRVCRICHAERLRGDLQRILDDHDKKKETI